MIHKVPTIHMKWLGNSGSSKVGLNSKVLASRSTTGNQHWIDVLQFCWIDVLVYSFVDELCYI